MSDLIDRQAAIDAIENAFDRETILNRFVRKIAISAVRLLPSAQPEQRVCETCKHYPQEKKWPCVDCDMREPADRWERVDNCPSAQAEQRWIPVSERMPEQKGIYPVWTAKGFGDHLSASYWDGEGWTLRVIAWMPLPEPYKGE